MTAEMAEGENPRANFVEIVRRRWWLVALCTVFGAGVAGLITASQQKEYEAATKLLFRVDTSPDLSVQSALGLTPAGTQIDPTRQAATDVALVSLAPVADLTAQALGHNRTSSEIMSEITVSAVGESDVIAITATDPSPAFAATLADTFARQFIVFRTNLDRSLINTAVQSVQSQLNGLVPAVRAGSGGRNLQGELVQLQALVHLQDGNAQLVQSAVVPSAPSLPRTKINVAAGGLLGLIAGIMLAVFLYRRDGKAETPEELAEQYRLPVLGVVPRTRELLRRRRRTGEDWTRREDGVALPATTAEAFRAVRARLRYFNSDQDLTSVLITSASRGEGKSTVAWQLARVIALTGNGRVLALETDLRQPTWARDHGLRPTPGLVDVITDRVRLEAAIQTIDPRAGETAVNGNGHGPVTRTRADRGADAQQTIDYTIVGQESESDFGPTLRRRLVLPGAAPMRWAHPSSRSPDASGRSDESEASTFAPTARPPGTGFVPSLDVLVAGATETNPSDLFESKAMADFLDILRERYDFVVLDAPPGPVVSDIFPLMSYVSGVVIVGSLRHASKRAAADLRDQLTLANAPVLGLVANNAKPPRDAYYASKRRQAASTNGNAGLSHTQTGNGPQDE